jgi:hypothetical protein
MNNVQHAVGQAGLLEQVCEEHRRRRVFLAWLQDECVAARDGVRQHPQRNHGREVERGDAGHNAERLTNGEYVDTGCDLLAEATLQ